MDYRKGFYKKILFPSFISKFLVQNSTVSLSFLCENCVDKQLNYSHKNICISILSPRQQRGTSESKWKIVLSDVSVNNNLLVSKYLTISLFFDS